jgi:hypothetical protein
MIDTQRFTYVNPNEEGIVELNLDFNFTNKSKGSCDLLHAHLVVELPNGVKLCCEELLHELSIGAGESEEDVFMGIGRGFHKSIFDRFKMEELKVHLTVNAYGKESRELGSWECPEEGECNLIEENFEFGDSAVIEGVCLRRAANGEDGNVEFDTHVVMSNLSDLYLPRVEFKAVLFDKKGEMIEESEDTQSVQPNGFMEFFPSFWDVKPSKVKGAKLEFSASCYHKHLGKFTADSQASLNE